ncbi:MAG TPA: hypothetical protein VGF28_07090 [Thermoanaerobaculia bacterium]
MSATGRRVEFLARAIVNRLEDRGVVEFVDAEAGILVVTRTLTENFTAVEQLERVARGKLGKRATEQQVENEMRRLAAERAIIL